MAVPLAIVLACMLGSSALAADMSDVYRYKFDPYYTSGAYKDIDLNQYVDDFARPFEDNPWDDALASQQTYGYGPVQAQAQGLDPNRVRWYNYQTNDDWNWGVNGNAPRIKYYGANNGNGTGTASYTVNNYTRRGGMFKNSLSRRGWYSNDLSYKQGNMTNLSANNATDANRNNGQLNAYLADTNDNGKLSDFSVTGQDRTNLQFDGKTRSGANGTIGNMSWYGTAANNALTDNRTAGNVRTNAYNNLATGEEGVEWGWLGLLGLIGLAGLRGRNRDRAQS